MLVSLIKLLGKSCIVLAGTCLIWACRLVQYSGTLVAQCVACRLVQYSCTLVAQCAWVCEIHTFATVSALLE